MKFSILKISIPLTVIFLLFIISLFTRVLYAQNTVGLDIILKPKENDTYIKNQATATVIGAKSSSDSASTTPGDSSGILPWAEKITAALQRGYTYNFFNKQQSDICNNSGYCAHKQTGDNTGDLYWCTFLVIDTYNLIGKKGLTPDPHLEVVKMMPFFRDTPGYIFLPYNSDTVSDPINKETLQKVKPGMAWFLAKDLTQTIESEHTGLVKSISIDENGNGSITTLESNSNQVSHIFPISSWDVQTAGAYGEGFPLRGFGGV